MANHESEYRIAGGLPVNVGMRQCDVAWLSSRMWSGTVVTPFDADPPGWRPLREILGAAICGFRHRDDMSDLDDLDQHELHDLGMICEPAPRALPAYSDQYGGC